MDIDLLYRYRYRYRDIYIYIYVCTYLERLRSPKATTLLQKQVSRSPKLRLILTPSSLHTCYWAEDIGFRVLGIEMRFKVQGLWAVGSKN